MGSILAGGGDIARWRSDMFVPMSASDSQLTMYSTVWCGYCQRLKAQMSREGITFTEIDIELDEEAAAAPLGRLFGRRRFRALGRIDQLLGIRILLRSLNVALSKFLLELLL